MAKNPFDFLEGTTRINFIISNTQRADLKRIIETMEQKWGPTLRANKAIQATGGNPTAVLPDSLMICMMIKYATEHRAEFEKYFGDHAQTLVNSAVVAQRDVELAKVPA